MPELPDFLHLDKAAREREENRQDTLRREFNSRARQSGPEIEMARAIIIEPSLRDALNRVTDQAEYAEISNRLADNLSHRGGFWKHLKRLSIRTSANLTVRPRSPCLRDGMQLPGGNRGRCRRSAYPAAESACDKAGLFDTRRRVRLSRRMCNVPQLDVYDGESGTIRAAGQRLVRLKA
jgi:hypothetical protein